MSKKKKAIIAVIILVVLAIISIVIVCLFNNSNNGEVDNKYSEVEEQSKQKYKELKKIFEEKKISVGEYNIEQREMEPMFDSEYPSVTSVFAIEKNNFSADVYIYTSRSAIESNDKNVDRCYAELTILSDDEDDEAEELFEKKTGIKKCEKIVRYIEEKINEYNI